MSSAAAQHRLKYRPNAVQMRPGDSQNVGQYYDDILYDYIRQEILRSVFLVS